MVEVIPGRNREKGKYTGHRQHKPMIERASVKNQWQQCKQCEQQYQYAAYPVIGQRLVYVIEYRLFCGIAYAQHPYRFVKLIEQSFRPVKGDRREKGDEQTRNKAGGAGQYACSLFFAYKRYDYDEHKPAYQ